MKPKQNAPQWIFGLFGSIIVLISVIFSFLQAPLWQQLSSITLNVGISIIAVSIIDWIWRRVGGDPLMNAILELRNTTALISDLYNAGIKRIFISRSLALERKHYLMEKITRGREVDMLGIALRSGWSSTPEFQELLRTQARKDRTCFRIVIFDPESPAVAQRTLEEDGKPTKRISESAASTLRTLTTIKNNLPSKDRDSLKIRVVKDIGLYCSIIRVDETMLVTKYLLHLSGSNSETLEIEGKDTNYFKLFMDEFNFVWDRAIDWPN